MVLAGLAQVCQHRAMDTVTFVRDELSRRRGQWIHIAKHAGVSYRALCNVAHVRNDPRVSTVEKLAAYLRRPMKEAA